MNLKNLQEKNQRGGEWFTQIGLDIGLLVPVIQIVLNTLIKDSNTTEQNMFHFYK